MTLPNAVTPRYSYPMAVARTVGGPSGMVLPGDSLVTGWSFFETTGVNPAVVQVLDGNDAGGVVVAQINLAPGQSVRDTTGAAGIYFIMGAFVNVVLGSVGGSLWLVDQ